MSGCINCQYVIEIRNPIPKEDEPQKEYYCLLFLRENSIMKLNSVHRDNDTCECFERK